MNRFSRLIASFFLLPALALPAWAESENRVVPANRPSRLGGMAIYTEPDCGYLGKPMVTIPVKPAHGTVKVVWSVGKLSRTDRPSSCTGKIVRGMSVIYSPQKGYRGPDVVKVGIRSNHGESTGNSYFAVTYNIDVK